MKHLQKGVIYVYIMLLPESCRGAGRGSYPRGMEEEEKAIYGDPYTAHIQKRGSGNGSKYGLFTKAPPEPQATVLSLAWRAGLGCGQQTLDGWMEAGRTAR